MPFSSFPSRGPLLQESTPDMALECLKRLPIFRTHPREALLRWWPFFYESLFTQESVLFYEGDLPDPQKSKLYFILEGAGTLLKHSTEGEGVVFRLLSEGDFFGLTNALTHAPYPFTARVQAHTRVLSLYEEDLRQMVNEAPSLGLDFSLQLGQLLWLRYETHNQVLKKTEARLAKLLLYHFHKTGVHQTDQGWMLNTLLPHHYLASMLGISYEESVRTLSRLRRQFKCIHYKRGGHMLISDLEELKRLSYH